MDTLPKGFDLSTVKADHLIVSQMVRAKVFISPVSLCGEAART